MKRQYVAPAAAATAAGLLFCTLFAPAARADETRDRLTDAASQAQQDYEDAQQQLDAMEEEQQATRGQIDALEAQAAEVRSQMQTVYSALLEAQQALAEAQNAEAAAAAALAAKQAEYDDTYARCKTQMRAMQKLDGGGSLMLLAQAKSLYQLLSFGEVLRQMAAHSSRTLAELDSQAQALEAERQRAAEAAARAAAARDALDAQQARLDALQGQLAQALQDADETLSSQQAAAEAQTAVTEEAKKAWEEASAALDRYARAQSRQYTTPDLYCSLDFRCPLDSYSYISTHYQEPDPWGIPHRGADFAAPGGTPVYAAADGVVSAAAAVYSYGNCVQISHGSDDAGSRYDTLYAHLSSFAVSAGQSVRRGDVIGYVGNTGSVYGAGGGYHLHLELRINGSRTDPLAYIPR